MCMLSCGFSVYSFALLLFILNVHALRFHLSGRCSVRRKHSFLFLAQKADLHEEETSTSSQTPSLSNGNKPRKGYEKKDKKVGSPSSSSFSSSSSAGLPYSPSTDENFQRFEKIYTSFTTSHQKKDVRKFSSTMKTTAYKNGLRIDHSNVIQPIVEDFLSQIKSHSLEVTASDLSDWLWSLPRVGFRLRNKTHLELYLSILNLFCAFENVTPRQLTTSLGGLSRMRLRWSSQSNYIKTAILKALDETALLFNDREVGNVLHSLQALQVSWSLDLTPSIRQKLLTTFANNAPLLVSQQGSMAIYGLGIMGCLLDQLEPQTQQKIFEVAVIVTRESNEESSREVAQQVVLTVFLFPHPFPTSSFSFLFSIFCILSRFITRFKKRYPTLFTD